MPRYFSGNITLYTTEILADSDTEYAKELQDFITEVKELYAYKALITRYGVNITYASQEVETKTNA
jgi:hypothetical protein